MPKITVYFITESGVWWKITIHADMTHVAHMIHIFQIHMQYSFFCVFWRSCNVKILIQVLDFFLSYRPQFPCWIGPETCSIQSMCHNTQALLLQPHSQKIFKQFAFSQMCPKKASALACAPVRPWNMSQKRRNPILILDSLKTLHPWKLTQAGKWN